MPRKPTNNRKVGCPKIPIDWKKADEMLMAGCLGTEIAAYFGCAADTFYDRCYQENGVNFTSYSASKKAVGESCLRKKQYDVAMEGDRTMLVWLGKNRLLQKDSHDVSQGQITFNIMIAEVPK